MVMNAWRGNPRYHKSPVITGFVYTAVWILSSWLNIYRGWNCAAAEHEYLRLSIMFVGCSQEKQMKAHSGVRVEHQRLEKCTWGAHLSEDPCASSLPAAPCTDSGKRWAPGLRGPVARGITFSKAKPLLNIYSSHHHNWGCGARLCRTQKWPGSLYQIPQPRLPTTWLSPSAASPIFKVLFKAAGWLRYFTGYLTAHKYDIIDTHARTVILRKAGCDPQC